MEKLPLVSFLLPNYNNERVIDIFFQKFLENNTYKNYEFIIIDDGSEDKSLDKINYWNKSKLIKNMKIIEKSHTGIIETLNIGLKEVNGEFFIRMDGDATIETKGFVEKFLKFYKINPEKIGAITAKVIFDNGKIHTAGRNIICLEGLHDRSCQILEPIGKRTFDSIVIRPQGELVGNEIAEIDTALGILTFSSKETALKIGGFDENYPLWIEDDDFYLSYRHYNKKIFYLPQILVIHRIALRGSRNPGNLNKEKMSVINRVKQNIKKNIKRNLPFLVDFYNLIKRNKISVSTIETNRWRIEILKHDYSYWNKKWGFDPINPDLKYILNRYKGTEITWRFNSTYIEQGKEIIKRFEDLGE